MAGYAGKERIRVWREVRQAALRRANYRCENCGAKSRLQVHHKHYKMVYGSEKVSDFKVLCRSCHLGVHADL